MGFFDEVKKQKELAEKLAEEKKKLEEERKLAEKDLKNAQKEQAAEPALSKIEQQAQEIERLKQQAEFARITPAQIAAVKIATSTICEKFEVIDTVFAIDVHKDSLFGGLFGGGAADPFTVFAGVNDILRRKCVHLGGTAVINCEFNWETGVSSEVLGISIPGFSRKLHMIYAYGTAVKITNQ